MRKGRHTGLGSPAAGLTAIVLTTVVALAAGGAVAGQSPTPGEPTSCPSPPTIPTRDPSAGPAPDLVVLAAASLTDVVRALAVPWAERHPGSALVAAFDASSTLRAQIEQGAPADLFAAADLANPQALADRCLVLAGPVVFAGNTLTIAVAAGDPAGIGSIADLARPGLRIVATAPEVPIARYAAAVLAAAAAVQPDPAAWSAAVTANTVSLEDNVRAALAKVELGEADAALVYVTDVAADPAVAAIPIPPEFNVTATYAAVVPWTAAEPALASDLLALLLDEDGRRILADAGFLPPPTP